jgi:hypothetical protein
MDNENVRSRSSQSHTSNDASDAQRVYGINWPFPGLCGPTPMTAKQIKADKAKQLSEYEEALL